ncbi:MAG: SPFH/Band 7/PHB domain protein [Candidatus Methanomethylophilaceae archaeon]|nr:SPFH/Band 7/PHB domain protein [Candidatus Methanomethylophilaceae archaeon]
MSIIIPILAVILLLAVIIVVLSGVKIVQPYEQAVYMRLGKYVRILNQGLNVVCPIVNEVVKMDLRTQVLDVPSQEVITKDNSPVNVDAIVYIKVTDPKNAFFEVTDYRTATVYLAQTTLRSIIGEMELDQILSNRERINIQLRDILDESTDKWGVKIETVEIREADPAQRVKESMEEQTSAERRRRAAILEAEGKKTAAILEAEGKTQSMILEAEGKRLATILEAQGEAQKLRLTSVGASSLDSKALAVLSMETLKSVGDGQSSKIYFPMELTKIVDGISSYMGVSNEVPERQIADRADIEEAVGRPEDVLGPIPSPEEIRMAIEGKSDSAKVAEAELKKSETDSE